MKTVAGAHAPHQARVVLIEDNDLIRLGQETLLRDWGHRVVAAATRDAIQDVLKHDPEDVAAIIAEFDIDGPHTGIDIALVIAATAGRRIPTAITSASFGHKSGTAAAMQGFAFFSKPIDPQILHDWLAGVLAGGA